MTYEPAPRLQPTVYRCVVIWAGFWGWWFLKESARQYGFWSQQIYEGQYGHPWAPDYRATPEELAEWEKYREQSRASSRLKEYLATRDFWLFILVAFVVFPLIVYGIVLGTGRVVRWIYRGFQSPPT
jgi:nitrate reductase NapE component